MKKAITIFLSAVIIFVGCIFTGCGAMTGDVTSDETKGTPVSEKEDTETDTHTDLYQGRDREKVQKHLEQYPVSFQELKKADVFVNTVSVALRKEKLYEFLASVQRGECTSMDIITFTIEGDAVPVYIQYNGKNFYCYESFANDSYAAKNSDQYTENTYKNMSLLDIPDGEFSDIDLSGMDTGFRQFVLSNAEIKDYSSFKKSEGDSYSIRISPFDSEKEAKKHIR